MMRDGQVARMKQAMAGMERASRAEPGCFEYAFATDVSDPTIVRIVERWESLEALRAHFATPHMAAFQAAMQKDPPAGMELKAYRVEEIPLPTR
jgi:quinol monooxygenase YgiN